MAARGKAGGLRPGIGAACGLLSVLAATVGWKAYPGLREWQLGHWPLERLRAESQAHPEDVSLQLQLGARLLESGNAAEARSVASQVLRIAPDRPGAWVLLGRAGLEIGQDAEATQALERALELDPRAADAHYILGELYTREGSSHGAIDHYSRYTRLRPHDPRGWNALAQSFLDIKEPGNALDTARHLLKERADDPTALAIAGEACRRLGQPDEAEACFRRALARSPDAAAAHTGLGRVDLERSHEPGRLDAALEQFREAVRLAPDDPDARYELGQALSQQGKLEEAVREWEQALARNPGETRCHYALAQALARLGRAREAEAHHAQVAKATRYEDEVGEAMVRLRTAQDPAAAQFDLARIYLRYDRRDQAAAALRAGLAAQPENAWARNMLAQMGAR